MSRPYFSVKHVESLNLLPEKLTPGRLYFIDDEQYIVIDHGNGLPPVIYGGKPGPQGASGEPQPHMLDQINTLAQTELEMQALIWDEGEKFRSELERLKGNFTEALEKLNDMANTNSQTIMSLAKTIKESFDNYDSAIAVLGKAVANLYPDPTWHDPDEEVSDTTGQDQTPNVLAQTLDVGDNVPFNGVNLRVNKYTTNADGSFSLDLQSLGEFSKTDDPLDNETAKTDAGSWTIQQTNLSDGSIVLDLTAQSSLVENLNTGDVITSDGTAYLVSDIQRNSDGSISLVLN